MTDETMIRLNVEYRVTFTKTITVPLDSLDYEMDIIDQDLPEFIEDEYTDPFWEKSSSEIVFTRVCTE